MGEDRLVYTQREVAMLLNLSVPSVLKGIQCGQIPSVRIGRRVLVPKVQLERFLTGESNV